MGNTASEKIKLVIYVRLWDRTPTSLGRFRAAVLRFKRQGLELDTCMLLLLTYPCRQALYSCVSTANGRSSIAFFAQWQARIGVRMLYSIRLCESVALSCISNYC